MSDVINKHSRMPKKGESAPVFSKRGNDKKPIPLAKRQEIIEDAKTLILQDRTIDQIADKHGIAPRTLEYWLAGLGDEYEELRRAWLDGMLMEAGELLKTAENPVAIAKARELWKRATWYAERRDRARYGQDMPQININLTDLGDRLRRARERTFENNASVEIRETGNSDSLRLARTREEKVAA